MVGTPRTTAAGGLDELSSGVVIGGVFALSAELVNPYLGGLVSGGSGLLGAALASGAFRRGRAVRVVAMLLGAGIWWFAEDWTRLLSRAPAGRVDMFIAACIVVAAVGACGGGAARGGWGGRLAAVGAAIGVFAPREVAVAMWAVAALAAIVAAAPRRRLRAPRRPAWLGPALFGLAAVAAAAWATAIVPLSASASPYEALLAGAIVGFVLPMTPVGLTLGGFGTAALIAVGVGYPAPGVDGTVLHVLPGVLVGAAAARARPGAAAVGLAALGPLAAASLVHALPLDVRARAAAAPDPEVAAARATASTLYAGVGVSGPRALHRYADGALLAEVAGAPIEQGRSSRAARFAATLAGCASVAPDGARARIVGDVLGHGTRGARAQRFWAIDVMVDDVALLRAVADADPRARDAWTGAELRLRPAPGQLGLDAPAPADALVWLVQPGGRGAAGSGALRAAASALTDGGAIVVAIDVAHEPAASVDRQVRAFARAFAGASAWIGPDTGDAVFLVARGDGAPLPWSNFGRCVERDAAVLADVGVRDAQTLALYVAADGAALRGTRAPLSTPGDLVQVGLDPARVFGADAPLAAIGALAEARRGLVALLAAAREGDLERTFAAARTLRGAPGGADALEPLIRPHLDRAAGALTRARAEGTTSAGWGDAEAALATALLLDPDHAAARCLEGEVAGARGQLERAKQAFGACVRRDPEHLAGWDGLARIARTERDASAAETALRAALRARPDWWKTSHNLGLFLLETGRPAEAEAVLRQGAALASRQTPQPAAPFLALAQLHLRTRQFALALAEAERAEALDGGAPALGLRGAARYELGLLDVAEEDFRAALARDPRNLLARGGLGQVYAARGQNDLAADAFRAVLELDPGNVPAAENLRRLAAAAR